MKTKRSLFSILLVLAVFFGLSNTASAASITINKAVEGQTYYAYKVFDATKSANSENYAYSIKSDNPWFQAVQNYKVDASGNYSADGDAVFTLTATVGDPTTFVVTVNNRADSSLFGTPEQAAKFASYLSKVPGSADFTNTSKTVPTGSNSIKLERLDPGYYFLDSTLGDVAALNTATGDQIVVTKNEPPTLAKKVKSKSGSNLYTDSGTYSIGDEVDFQLTIKAGGKAKTSYVVNDTMSDGLALKPDSFVIKELKFVSEDNYTETTLDRSSGKYAIRTNGLSNGHTFEIEFPQTYTNTLSKKDKLVIDYKATVTTSATQGTDAPNTNVADLTYGNTTGPKKTVKVLTYGFDIVKTDVDNNHLAGASFELYKNANNGEKIKLVEDGSTAAMKVYRPATAEEAAAGGFQSAVVQAGIARIKGLKEGTYYLQETAAPAGYNMLTERTEIVLGDSESTTNGNIFYTNTNGDTAYSNGEGGVQVINHGGTELPTTGGIGTTIFYIIGGLIMVGALIFLVARKKDEKEEN